jgi:hypothetical protein
MQMIKLQTDPRSRCLLAPLAAGGIALACGVLAAPLWAAGGLSGNSSGTSGGGGASGVDCTAAGGTEGIGSLPSTFEGDLALVGGANGAVASEMPGWVTTGFMLESSVDHLLDAIQAVVGKGLVVAALAPDGDVRLVFIGDISVLLDRQQIELGLVDATIYSGQTFLGGYAALETLGTLSPVVTVTEDAIPIGLGYLSMSGLLAHEGSAMLLANDFGNTGRVGGLTVGDSILVTQVIR